MRDWRGLASFWLSFIIAVFIWIRLARYEFHPQPDGLYVFDRWTTRIERAKVHSSP